MTDGAVTWLALELAAMGAGEVAVRGDRRLTGRYACYRVYACKGAGFYSVGALEPKFWATLCQAVGKPELVPLQFAEGTEGVRVHHEMEAVFATRSRVEWQHDLDGLEVCCEPVLELDEIEAHPQVVARRLIERNGE